MDAGIGDGPYEPLPLREGAYEQGGLRYRMQRAHEAWLAARQG
ncbi:hypothetical protein AB0B78_02495 [Streptomyces sp. NPDC040724]